MTTVCSLITFPPPVIANTKVGADTKTTQSKTILISPQKQIISNKVKNPCQKFVEKGIKKGQIFGKLTF